MSSVCILIDYVSLILLQDVMESDGESIDDGSSATSWTLQFRDLPDANKARPVTSRAMADMPIVSGDPLKFMAAMEYT